jgi:NADPH-dependent 2,4-dienoyl-CoA reductase/sulfur reductase-like enzyme
VNPEVGREREMALRTVSESKRVLVAGGGPAGMVAAGVAALRGHHVTLFERESSLGGQLRVAAVPPMKQEISPYLKYLESQLYKAGVDVRCGQELTASAVLDAQPDCVVVATGGRPLVPKIPGIDSDRVVTAVDVLTGKSVAGRRVLVAGGGMVGCETAESLAEYGKHVTIVEMLPVLASDMVVGPRQLLLDRLKERGVETVTSARVVEITADGAVVEREGQRRTIGGMDTVVLAMGVTSVDELAAQVRDRVPELHVIGDAASPGKALEAIAAGAEVGRQI